MVISCNVASLTRGICMCPKIGVSPVILHFGLGLSVINHLLWGTPMTIETPISIHLLNMMQDQCVHEILCPLVSVTAKPARKCHQWEHVILVPQKDRKVIDHHFCGMSPVTIFLRG